MVWISIVEAVAVGLVVGVGCYQWGKEKGIDYQIHNQKMIDENKQKEVAEKRKLEEQAYIKGEKDKENSLKLIKAILKKHNLINTRFSCIGIYYILREKYGYIPDERIINNFITSFKQKVKEQK